MDNSHSKKLLSQEAHSKTHVCASEQETVAFGKRLAGELIAGDIVCITGELGAGKTVLCRGIAAGLGVDPSDVRSPTFAIAHEYSGTIDVLHFDCYRLTKAEEALQIGWDDYLERQAVILIEWPEIIKELLPENYLHIEIKATAPEKQADERHITIQREKRL